MKHESRTTKKDASPMPVVVAAEIPAELQGGEETGMAEYWEYDELRRGFERLADEFSVAVAKYPGVYHQLIWSPDKGPLSIQSWRKFIAANSRRLLMEPDEREQWVVAPNGQFCIRFYWSGLGAGLNEFIRLANTGGKLLRQSRLLLAEGVPVPMDMRLDLYPPIVADDWQSSNAHFDWLLALYDTGSICHTMHLHVVPGLWVAPATRATDLAAVAAAHERSEQTQSLKDGGHPFPTHPFVQSLEDDLFRSSYDAIRLWLDPDDEDIVRVGRVDGNSPIYLPPTEDEMEEEEEEEAEDDEAEPAEAAVPVPEMKPRYDVDRRQLFVGYALIKQFRQSANNQESILMEFEGYGWPTRVDNPIPSEHGMVAKRRLQDAVIGLNKNHVHPNIIRFRTDGTGMAVLWELVQEH